MKYTYIYGYFLPSSSTSADSSSSLVKSMFEVQQAFAQNICEQLSKDLFLPISELDRNKAVYHLKACKQYFHNLVKFFENEEEKELYSPRIEKKVNKKKAKVKKEREVNHWICRRCTFSNPSLQNVCSLCQLDRTLDV